MKKIIVAFSYLLASCLIAAPANTPNSSTQFESGLITGDQSSYNVRVGYLGEFISNRNLKNKVTGSHIDQVAITRNGAVVTVGILNRLDLFFGAGKATYNDLRCTTTYPETRLNVRDANFWTLGARSAIWTHNDLTVNGFADYTNTSGTVRRLSVSNSEYYASLISPSIHLKSWDYRVGIGASYTVQVTPDFSIIPSVSAHYSDCNYSFGNKQVDIVWYYETLDNQVAHDHFGIEIGCALYAGKMFGFNIAGSFLDSTGVSVSADVRL